MESLIAVRVRACRALAIGIVLAAGLAGARAVSTAAPAPWVALPGSVLGTNAHLIGTHPAGAPLTISVVLQPNNAAGLASLLSALYDPSSPRYHQWLPKGVFAARFGPPASVQTQVAGYLQSQGLRILASPSPFLVRATGSTAHVEAAFNTHISDYRAAGGTTFFSNDTSVYVPTSLGELVTGVVGLSSTARAHPQYLLTRSAAQHRGAVVPNYGGGPGGSGLTPSQLAGIYDANGIYRTGPRGQGAGKTLAVFELSGYTQSDITVYEHQFFGTRENVPLVDVNVDGGPINPMCPTGDTCLPGYSGDIEVEADIEAQIAIAPRINSIRVYNAPSDLTGQTEIDEYLAIARDDTADSISSSWAECEQDAGFANAQAESIAFQQMAAQGQSMFAASGDTGAFGCLRDVGSPYLTDLAILDPSSQPWVTAVGGTSFESYDPASNNHPTYPTGVETVWNPLNLCSGSPNGLSHCDTFGAGGGGNSVFWPRPAYQGGPGVQTSYSRQYPYCSQASAGQACREVPDISANADGFNPYAEYCTGNPNTNSTCATFSSTLNQPGWFGQGGTSLSSPLWSAIIALSDSYHEDRTGVANVALYRLFRSPGAYSTYFHNITGLNQTEDSNGFFPVTPNYDEATGIGTPRITALAEAGL